MKRNHVYHCSPRSRWSRLCFLFLQGWRATLIPLLAFPVYPDRQPSRGSPLLAFSINLVRFFGRLVPQWGWVVDDANSVVVEGPRAPPLEGGLFAKAAAFRKAMEEVSGRSWRSRVILSPSSCDHFSFRGITGRLYQQFAVTIAISRH